MGANWSVPQLTTRLWARCVAYRCTRHPDGLRLLTTTATQAAAQVEIDVGGHETIS